MPASTDTTSNSLAESPLNLPSYDTSTDELRAITARAASAAPAAAASTDAERAAWLEAIAAALDADADGLIELADRESHLGTPRLTGELARTTAQLRLFARVVLDGGYLEATIDHPNPGGTPPSPDLRRVLRPLGPVAVFSASNFPFAFSVAGGDTASALAVGCPVVVKAHPGHPQLSVRTAALVTGALTDAGAPDGIFALVTGFDAGPALVTDPHITAVAFTGSLHGGRALFDLAVSRPGPIPFYGELGSVNPVIVTQAAQDARGPELAAGLAASFTLGVGQFCTKPGIVLVPDSPTFGTAVAAALAPAAPTAGSPASPASTTLPTAPMLTDGLAAAFARGVDAIATHPAVTTLVGDPAASTPPGEASPLLLETTASAVLADPDTLLAECFGPTTLIVRYPTLADALAVVTAIGGSLTATLHADPADTPADTPAIVDTLARTAGRVLFGGWPTGVAVTHSQHHGGPWPSTTNPLHTSVGATAVRRFQRPIAYQSAPDAALPPALQEANPLNIPRRVDSTLTLPARAVQ